MPSIILNKMKTAWVDDNPWTSPDGKVTIWSIKLEDGNGERNTYSTMSKAIAKEGWSGDIELYTNAKGKEYVRQAPKEEKEESKYEDRGDAITASMAVKLAFSQFCHVETMLPQEDKHWRQIDYMAEMIYKSINKIKGIEKEDKEIQEAAKEAFISDEPPFTEKDAPDWEDQEN